MLLLWQNSRASKETCGRTWSIYICDECIELCSEIIEEEFEETRADAELNDIPKPSEIKEILDQYVVGQDTAKKALAVAGLQPLQKD